MEERNIQNRRKALREDIQKLKSKYHRSEVRTMPVTIPFTDGFGISLRKIESSMIRLPFIKGLIAYCPRRAFVDWCSANSIPIHKVVDIYGKYGCDACRCNVERGVKLNSKTNYQVLQTLTTEMTDDDILSLASYDINCLNGIGRNVQCMLNVLGANEKKNDHMNWLQKSLILYPEMLKDFYVKTLLKNTKDSMIKNFRSGKFSINGAYVFAIPDTLACLQYWFTDIDKTDLSKFGFVRQGNVSCRLFQNQEELDCLRSPHLYLYWYARYYEQVANV